MSVVLPCILMTVFNFFPDCMINSVTLSHNGITPPVIGDETTYAFNCIVAVVDCDANEQPMLTVTFNPNGAPVSGDTVFGIDVMGDSSYSANLTLATPIEVSHGQLFTCNATFNESSPAPVMDMDSEPFNVTRESTPILVHVATCT